MQAARQQPQQQPAVEGEQCLECQEMRSEYGTAAQRILLFVTKCRAVPSHSIIYLPTRPRPPLALPAPAPAAQLKRLLDQLGFQEGQPHPVLGSLDAQLKRMMVCVCVGGAEGAGEGGVGGGQGPAQAGQGREEGRAGQGRAGQGRAGQGRTGQARPGQGGRGGAGKREEGRAG